MSVRMQLRPPGIDWERHEGWWTPIRAFWDKHIGRKWGSALFLLNDRATPRICQSKCMRRGERKKQIHKSKPQHGACDRRAVSPQQQSRGDEDPQEKLMYTKERFVATETIFSDSKVTAKTEM
jgi:hypothetical protein